MILQSESGVSDISVTLSDTTLVVTTALAAVVVSVFVCSLHPVTQNKKAHTARYFIFHFEPPLSLHL